MFIMSVCNGCMSTKCCGAWYAKMYSEDQYRRKHLENNSTGNQDSTVPTTTIPQTTSMMYHDMGYYQHSHNYSNYLMPYGETIDTNAYDNGGAPPVNRSPFPCAFPSTERLMHHLMPNAAPAAQQSLPFPPQMPPMMAQQPSFGQDQMHHQQMAMMSTQEQRTWYQPPIAMHQQADHR